MRSRTWRVVRSLSARIFLGYFLVLGVVAYASLSYFSNAIKPAVRQTMEEAMVDEAGLLAVLIEARIGTGEVVPRELEGAFRELSRRDLLALINGVAKHRWDQRVYITDARGFVRFDSTAADLGADYSRWNNVKLALEGKYGARSTHYPAPDGPSTMHVSSAIRRDDAIVGVVTVAKRVADVDPFVEQARARLLRTGAFGFALSLGVGLLLSWLLSRSVSRLVTYAEQASEGVRVAPPNLGGELGALASAMERMRTGLEGKAYVEQAMQTFAHEMKSPLSGILAAAELLEGDLAVADRARFASQVQTEARRMQLLLERLLELAVVEQRQTLRDPGPLAVGTLVEDVKGPLLGRLEQKGLTIAVEDPRRSHVRGEAILLQQALRNLLDNAVDFASQGSTIQIVVARANGSVILRIHNTGPVIPDFAKARLFERFYSLPRPSSGLRSQGLGLAFVREVTELHEGTIELVSEALGEEAGVTAIWALPAADKP